MALVGAKRAIGPPHFAVGHPLVLTWNESNVEQGQPIHAVRESIAARKLRLDELRLIPREALSRLEQDYDVELTYTSNAIEGNTPQSRPHW